jgi:hypothetical protein
MERTGLRKVSIELPKNAEVGLIEACRLFKHCIEHGRQVAGRGVDHLQHLGHSYLLFQRLALLGDQPRIIDRDDSLIGKRADKLDLPVGKRLHPLAGKQDDSNLSSSRSSGTPSEVRCFPSLMDVSR